jgi:hypothetical protein
MLRLAASRSTAKLQPERAMPRKMSVLFKNAASSYPAGRSFSWPGTVFEIGKEVSEVETEDVMASISLTPF